MLRVVFFGNSASGFTTRHFEALLAAPADLIGLVDLPQERRSTTNPIQNSSSALVQEAYRQDIPIFTPESTDESGFINSLSRLNPDLFIVIGYALILKQRLLELPRLMAVNFHASLLPEYRGKHPVFWALRNAEKWAGLSVHAMDRGIDTGDLIYQVRVRTRRNDSVASLYERIMARSLPLVERLVHDAARGNICPYPQPQGSGSYYSGTNDEDFRLDWNWPAERIRRYITITPGKCYIELDEGRLYIIDARTEVNQNAMPPGSILRIGRQRAVVAASPGAVSVGQVRLGERKVESMAAFCQSKGIVAGDIVT
jgi:methionyl-tRNA formyltransferase